MSEQERYGQEPEEAREPYAPYPPGYPAQDPRGAADPRQGQAYDPYAGAPQQGYDTGTHQVYDPAYYQQGYPQQPYPAQPGHDRQAGGYDPSGGYGGQAGWTQQQIGYQDPAAHQGQPGAQQDVYGGRQTGYQDPAVHQTHHNQQGAPAASQTRTQGHIPPQRDPYPQTGHPDAGPYPGNAHHTGADSGTTAEQDVYGGQDAYGGQDVYGGPGGGYPDAHGAAGPDGVPHAAAGEDGEQHAEEFAFVEEEDEQAEDVIDWLKFSESRTERRDERKRRGRSRTLALALVVVLAVAGGGTYAWKAGLIPGLGAGAATPLAAQKRDVIVVHLREVDSNDSSTILLVRNETTGRGSTVLLPNSLTVSTDDGAMTLGKSVVSEGAGPTRDGLDTLLGANIQGTWRLDTPFLEVLVDALGGIEMTPDATVTQAGKPVVTGGKDQSLNGKAAVAYATYRAPGETAAAQLTRFGQVMRAVLMQVPSSGTAATKIIDQVGSVPDPSLSDGQLGATLAALSDLVKSGHYATTGLPVETNGTLSQQATDTVVKQILGGTVKNTDTSGIPTVSVRDATTGSKAAAAAQVQVIDAGDTYIDGGRQTPRATSQVLYGTAKQKSAAQQLGKTLGLPASDVVRGTGAANADLTVVLGADYHLPADTPQA
ncbi:LytR C-terminal domain-containing protein [Streptomyces sp. SL13]|uniref:LytR C-terminal domain-containing protein n=1 Tax=Streptantibioticus silvisoli TaxID=2705255 RepID=A0AA90KBC5_9ACTN|nr:LytR C-terminal domain-containing protein [Streptantibioticus silvisoli]MDI5973137.1 LytR C-terminal domain-containing protein [Streptantibioticus silvisoli]